MRVSYVSDVHLETWNPATPPGEVPWEKLVAPGAAPVLALCGDVGRPGSPLLRGLLAWAAPRWEAVLVVRGNHDAWGATAHPRHWKHRPHDPPRMAHELLEVLVADAAAAGPNVHVLERGAYAHPGSGVVFLGCPLWTAVPPAAVAAVEDVIGDYKYIAQPEHSDDGEGGNGSEEGGSAAAAHTNTADCAPRPFPRRLRLRPATTDDTNAWHARDAAWLSGAIAHAIQGSGNGVGGATRIVLLTHHLPEQHAALTPPAYRGDTRLAPAFATPGLLGRVLADAGDARGVVRAWLCGHSHVAATLAVPHPLAPGATVTVAVNALGYGSEPVPGHSAQAAIEV